MKRLKKVLILLTILLALCAVASAADHTAANLEELYTVLFENLKEQDPETTVTAEKIAAITDMQEAFGILFDRGFGPGPMGGPGRDFGGMESGNEGEPSVDFFMNDTVNAFSGVADEAAD